MFNWSNITPDIPRLTDVINGSGGPIAVLRLFTYPWIWFLGGWFIAMIIGALGAALYIKYDNVMVPAVFFIIMSILFGGVLSADSGGYLGSADIFMYIVILLAAFCIGFLLYKLFVK
jgi:hypothetical protein